MIYNACCHASYCNVLYVSDGTKLAPVYVHGREVATILARSAINVSENTTNDSQ